MLKLFSMMWMFAQRHNIHKKKKKGFTFSMICVLQQLNKIDIKVGSLGRGREGGGEKMFKRSTKLFYKEEEGGKRRKKSN